MENKIKNIFKKLSLKKIRQKYNSKKPNPKKYFININL